MLYGMNLSGTGAMIERARMENLSNNLANLDTVGFKNDLLSIMQRPVESKTVMQPWQLERLFYGNDLLDRVGGGVWLSQTHTAHMQGGLRETENKFDFAIAGDGFFQVQEAISGRNFYTRAGNFQVNGEGWLVSADGESFVLDEKGQRINANQLLESNAGVELAVSPGGEIQAILASGGTVNTGTRLGIIVFDGEAVQRLVKQGHTMFAALDEETAARGHQLADIPASHRRTTIKQGFVEASGSNVVDLMREMVEVNRAYERNMRMTTLQDSTLDSLIGKVARI